MRWEQGRAAIERMLADSDLQRVPASREQADRLLAQARVHVASALTRALGRPWPSHLPSWSAADGANRALARKLFLSRKFFNRMA
jgi:hypothetical protein